ncbi:sucrose transport protein [Venturia nashicola]|uniref:Sucrose transport protein n=1 Tax=Venturia nashicola TaxID=86259 RepID=A0A4Z1NTD8_9PEZI|nr:sucrose transport protein [Venturia nashicola]TLD29956.1 sucrose transport protein [Venturia nashicola]
MPQSTSWAGTAHIKGSSEASRMILLTVSLIGIQSVWNLEMTYCTPYLLRLGLTKDKVSLVWIAGPLSGLLMHPLVGIIADRSTSRWGRRRPFMLMGTLIVLFSLFILAWTAEVVDFLISDKALKKPVKITLAILSIYGVDFAINAVQACMRSLVADTLPTSQQQLGAAWASRMVAVGSLVGYGLGSLDLQVIFGSAMGDSQFKQLTIVAGSILLSTVLLTCWAVSERVLVIHGKEDDEEREQEGIVAMFTQIWTTTFNLPARVSAVCWIQFWSWIGWFPFLFYTSVWVGEVYLRYNAPAEARDHSDSVGQIGRIGSTALVAFSVTTFASSVIAPWFIEEPEESNSGFTPRPPQSIAWLVTEVQKYKPQLITAWSYSHVVFAGSMILAPFVTSLRAATGIIAMCGIPWAFQCWAPFTFMGMEINRLNQKTFSGTSIHKARESVELRSHEKTGHLDTIEEEPPESSHGDLSGLYLGILNIFTTLPQFIGTFISWIVFSLLEPGKSPELAKEAHPDEHHSTDGPNAIAVCLFIGALAAIIAAYKTEKYARMLRADNRQS